MKFKWLRKFPLLTRLLGWRGFYQFINKNPNDFTSVCHMYLLHHTDNEYREDLINSLKQNPQTEAFIQQKKPIVATLEDLDNMPKDSLGKHYFEFLQRYDLPCMFSDITKPYKSEYHFVIQRMLEIHDVFHVLLNAKPDLEGEGMVAFFTLAQIPAYLPPSLHFVAGIAHCSLYKRHRTYQAIDCAVAGWMLGQRLAPLYCINWDELWHLPINKVREKLDIPLFIVNAEESIKLTAQNLHFAHKQS